MNGTVYIAIGRNLIILAVEREFQEVHQVSFELFFRINGGNLLVVVTELGFEDVKDWPFHRDLAICFIKRLGNS